jgi:large subunit ribosomal protein L29
MKMHDLNNLPKPELEERLRDAETELSNLKFQQATHQLQNPLKLRTVRRDVARLKTLLRQDALGIRTTRNDEQS